MSLHDAIAEAYADPEVDDDILDTIEINHPTFDTPIRVACNAEADITLPLGPGQGGSALFKACPVAVTLSGYDDDGPTSGTISVDNLSGHLIDPLREAVKAGFPLSIVYRGYTMSDTSDPEVRGGVILSKVSLSATSATGTIEPATKADRQAFPRYIYSLAEYPALHGQS